MGTSLHIKSNPPTLALGLLYPRVPQHSSAFIAQGQVPGIGRPPQQPKAAGITQTVHPVQLGFPARIRYKWRPKCFLCSYLLPPDHSELFYLFVFNFFFPFNGLECYTPLPEFSRAREYNNQGFPEHLSALRVALLKQSLIKIQNVTQDSR